MTLNARRLSWQAVRDRIRAMILDGTYGAGDKLPRDEDIAAQFGCARSTVQRAMRDLADAGVVDRRRKGGSRVSADPVTRATFEIPVLRKEIESKGATYGYQLIDQGVGPAPREVALRMGLDPAAHLLRVQSLHLADGQAYAFEDRWISLDTVPEIAVVDLGQQSANEWLLRNRPYTRCDLRFSAVNATDKQARLFGTAPGTALFATERTTWIGDAPITSVLALAAPGYALVTRI